MRTTYTKVIANQELQNLNMWHSNKQIKVLQKNANLFLESCCSILGW